MNYSESNTNALVVSKALRLRYPAIANTFKGNCDTNQVKYIEVDAINIWVRDYLPVQVNSLFIKFRYGYDRDNPQYPSLSVKRRDWAWLPYLKPSGIRLDGGNVVRDGDRVVMTDIIFRHNPDKKRVIYQLEELLQAQITIVPAEPGDDIGHTDGICHFAPGGELLVAAFCSGNKTSARYGERLTKALRNFNITPFPHAYRKRPKMTEKQFRARFPQADTFNSGYGYYINFLVVGKLLFMPQFGIDEDANAITEVAHRFPSHKIVPVMCDKLSIEGGLCNCVGMAYKL